MQFTSLQYAKVQKKEQKRARLELKEKSNEERRQLVTQVLEVQLLLESFDDEVKEHFLNGTNGAVVSYFSVWYSQFILSLFILHC